METEVALDETQEILRRYRRLLRHAKPFLKPGDTKLIKKAFGISMEAHKDMRRKSGEPYIYHPLEVAQICVEEIGLGTTSIICALMHDVVEDSADFEVEDIEREFGPKVARIIDGLTKISGVFDYGTSAQAENFRKMILHLSDDVRVILIKLADRLHNMRTLEAMPRHKQLKIASETIYLYAPLAHRLGLYAIKSELEDLWLRFTDRESYYAIAAKIKDTRTARQRFIREFIRPIQNELREQTFDFTIKGRPKSIYSIWNKMRSSSVPFEQIYDLFAIRIILRATQEQEKSACWQVYSIVTDYYKPNPDRLRDWISTPKTNGYESLHTTVMSKAGRWVEVQIRTERMDEIAEKGYAAHWKYKDDRNDPGATGLDRWIHQVRGVLHQADTSALEFVDNFRSSLYSEEVFCFTPKGELKVLPNGATALDFAFDIHTEVGLNCLGAKINHKLVPLGYILQNGDQVEILTSKKQKPTDDWLRQVVTSKARRRIQEYLRDQKKQVAAAGREILERKLAQLKLEPTHAVISRLLSALELPTALELHYRLAEGQLDPNRIKKVLGEDGEKVSAAQALNGLESPSPSTNGKAEAPVSPAKDMAARAKELNKSTLLIGDNLDEVDFTLATCCNPIPGDEVFGFVTVNEGIKIHRTSCPNAAELLSHYGYRVVKAQWAEKKIEREHLVGLRIRGTDRMGLLSDITNIISRDLRVNIKSINAETTEGIVEDVLMLFVKDTRHLGDLMAKLGQVQGILSVHRFEPK